VSDQFAGSIFTAVQEVPQVWRSKLVRLVGNYCVPESNDQNPTLLHRRYAIYIYLASCPVIRGPKLSTSVHLSSAVMLAHTYEWSPSVLLSPRFEQEWVLHRLLRQIAPHAIRSGPCLTLPKRNLWLLYKGSYLMGILVELPSSWGWSAKSQPMRLRYKMVRGIRRHCPCGWLFLRIVLALRGLVRWYNKLCVCVCECVCVRACVRACVFYELISGHARRVRSIIGPVICPSRCHMTYGPPSSAPGGHHPPAESECCEWQRKSLMICSERFLRGQYLYYSITCYADIIVLWRCVMSVSTWGRARTCSSKRLGWLRSRTHCQDSTGRKSDARSCVLPVSTSCSIILLGSSAGSDTSVWSICAHVLCAGRPGYRSRYSDSLQAGRSGDRIPVMAKFSAPVQTGPGANPASCTMCTVPFPGVKLPGRGARHTTPF
jgi:hypothetical protein